MLLGYKDRLVQSTWAGVSNISCKSLNNKHLDRVKLFLHQTGPGLMTWVPELVGSCWDLPFGGQMVAQGPSWALS